MHQGETLTPTKKRSQCGALVEPSSGIKKTPTCSYRRFQQQHCGVWQGRQRCPWPHGKRGCNVCVNLGLSPPEDVGLSCGRSSVCAPWSQFRKFRRDHFLTDISIVAKGIEFKAHQIVLAAQCPAIEAYIRQNGWGARSAHVDFENHVVPEAWQLFVDFFYKEPPPLEKEWAWDDAILSAKSFGIDPELRSWWESNEKTQLRAHCGQGNMECFGETVKDAKEAQSTIRKHGARIKKRPSGNCHQPSTRPLKLRRLTAKTRPLAHWPTPDSQCAWCQRTWTSRTYRDGRMRWWTAAEGQKMCHRYWQLQRQSRRTGPLKSHCLKNS